jgi:hypothetical protein
LNIPTIDLVIASAAAGLFVMPTLYHLAADLAARPGRNFSLIPQKALHLIISLLRLGAIVGAAATGETLVWFALVALMVIMMAASVTERRLTIDAESGLVKWRKISLAWWPAAWSPVGFVDSVEGVRFKSRDKQMKLLGIATLDQRWSTNYNGSVSTSGHYSENTLAWIAEQTNEYLEAFRRHDTEPARKERTRVREQVQALRAPRRKRKEARRERANRAESGKKQRLENKGAAREARKERARARRLEKKFQQ